MFQIVYPEAVERWGVFEIEIHAHVSENPFLGTYFLAEFTGIQEKKQISGFYDGNDRFRIRFMPSFEGEYSFRVMSGMAGETLEDACGTFQVNPAGKGNHGPVRVKKPYHFRYEDGTRYDPVGTTCYAWIHQEEKLQEQTLQTLESSCFNKLRFCIFPKHYRFNFREPELYPFEGEAEDFGILTWDNFMQVKFSTKSRWDYTRFVPEYFRRIESRIADLCRLGIEADLILLHPYDRWGFAKMPRQAEELYYRYVIARFSAYRNVWWAQANEYEYMPDKTEEDWERLGKLLMEEDPYGHLRSIHNNRKFYDHTREWITHCSIQRVDMYKTVEETNEWRSRWGKPVVVDELCYEGNICMDWGNISGEELVRRSWEITVRGGYTGHGETFESPDDILWWSHGGTLHGSSEPRLRFLRELLEQVPGDGLRFLDWTEAGIEGGGPCGEAEGEGVEGLYRIYYFGKTCPARKRFVLPEGFEYEVDVIDTWNMDIAPQKVSGNRFMVELPGREYMAVRIRRK